MKFKYENIFPEGCVPNWSEEVLWLKKLKTLCHEHVISDLNGEEIAGKFYEKEL